MTASRAVTAPFTAAPDLRVFVSAPTGSGSHVVGDALPVTWSADRLVAAGQFSIWRLSPAVGRYSARIVATNREQRRCTHGAVLLPHANLCGDHHWRVGGPCTKSAGALATIPTFLLTIRHPRAHARA